MTDMMEVFGITCRPLSAASFESMSALIQQSANTRATVDQAHVAQMIETMQLRLRFPGRGQYYGAFNKSDELVGITYAHWWDDGVRMTVGYTFTDLSRTRQSPNTIWSMANIGLINFAIEEGRKAGRTKVVSMTIRRIDAEDSSQLWDDPFCTLFHLEGSLLETIPSGRVSSNPNTLKYVRGIPIDYPVEVWLFSLEPVAE